MTPFDYGTDLARAFAEQWNRRLRSVRIASFIVSVAMRVFGVFEIVDYCCRPIFLHLVARRTIKIGAVLY